VRSLDDTIAAIATPPGEGGIAVVRISGSAARDVGRVLLRSSAGAPVELAARAVRWARAQAVDGRSLDEVLALWLPGPASYTREDVLEIQCHGGYVAARAVLDAVLAAGPRLAEPGEFTLRAYLGGRLDLLQAEAVLDVIRARTEESLGVHEEVLGGGLSREVNLWQEELGKTLTHLEAHLDFPDEDLGAPDLARLRRRLDSVILAMEDKLATFAWGRTTRDGFSVALIGSPNTGKSSLLNRLLDEDRAIVSPIPGTTRDTIEAWFNALGVPVRLLDTAGLRTVAESVEQEGVRRARAAAARADLILYLTDGGRPLTEEEIEEAALLAPGGRTVPVVNKADLGILPARDLERIFDRPPAVLSALTGQGESELLALLRQAAWGGSGPSTEVPLTRRRHRSAIEISAAALRRAAETLEQGRYLEAVASEIHAARGSLRELLGWGTPEDVLEDIFAEFCIGK
jgi:tRNA modification GTPase